MHPDEYEPTEEHVTFASIEAEQLLIGGLLTDQTPAQEVMAIVEPEDFFRKDHKIIFSIMGNLLNEDTPLDPILVAEKSSLCAKRDLLSYTIELASSAAGSCNARAYARLIRENAIKRAVLQSAHQIADHVNKHPDERAQESVSFAQSQIIRISNTLTNDSVIATPGEALTRCIADIDRKMHSDEQIFGLSSGYPNIDYYTTGYSPGELIILAGRPSMGKSTLAICIGASMSLRQQKRGAFFTLEMPEAQVMRKLLSAVAKVDYKLLKNPKLVRDHESFWLRIQKAGQAIKHSGFNIVDCPGAHINQIAAYARKMHLSAPLDWIMIDHMHLIGADGRNEIEKLTQISNTAKRIARELSIPVILLAQLNRALESRPDKRPVMSDIRGSGSVEQDADIIHFVYRDDYYNKNRDNPNAGLVEVETAKQRDGELGVAVLENVYSQSRLVMTDRKIIQPTRASKLSMIEGL